MMKIFSHVILFIAGSVFLLGALDASIVARHVLHGVRTSGEIQNVTSSSSTELRGSHNPRVQTHTTSRAVVTFRDAAGREHSALSPQFSDMRNVGPIVTVWYMKDAPDDAIVVLDSSPWLEPAIFALGFAILAAAWIAIRVATKRSRTLRGTSRGHQVMETAAIPGRRVRRT